MRKPTKALARKLQLVKVALARLGSVVVAYSGGVDSSLLAAVAHEVLGDCMLAVIAATPLHPQRERRAALRWLRQASIPFEVLVRDRLDAPAFRDNPPDRCYGCKLDLLGAVVELAGRRGFAAVLEGTNADDEREWRPGSRAVAELGVVSPLRDARLTKDEIRALARDVYGIAHFAKPGTACLATRIPHGTAVTLERVEQVDAMEAALERLGFTVFRARHEGDAVRLQVGPDEVPRLVEPAVRAALLRAARRARFARVTADLAGYGAPGTGPRPSRPGAAGRSGG